jgi:hypothetical protein
MAFLHPPLGIQAALSEVPGTSNFFGNKNKNFLFWDRSFFGNSSERAGRIA